MIELRGLSTRAGDFALRDVSVAVPRGAWGIVLGPAGAGKTTLLETIAGIRTPTAGRLLLRGADVTTLPAERRGVALVYQHGYLFPHLSVAGNIAYGCHDDAYAIEIAARFGADPLLGRPVRSLSGGERQIVALCRALAARPDILLLDEPFAALDPRRRTRVRQELRALQREQSLTLLHVTHDFAEAGLLGDLALLMEGGRLVQVAPPAELFRHPGTRAAAEFLGVENVYAGQVVARTAGTPDGPDALAFQSGAFSLVAIGTCPSGPAHAVIRGEDVTLSRVPASDVSARNVFAGVVQEIATSGVIAQVTVDLDGTPLIAVVTAASVAALGLLAGSPVVASVKANAVHLC